MSRRSGVFDELTACLKTAGSNEEEPSRLDCRKKSESKRLRVEVE
ncbi:MAG: hypothetical protein U0936_24260 [Planctomycetaceae bacterium]